MYDEEGYVIGTAVAKSIIKNVSNQNFILSMGQLSAFLSASGIDIKYGPYPYYAKSVTVSGFPSYSAPPSNPIPSNPIPSNPIPSNPIPSPPPLRPRAVILSADPPLEAIRSEEGNSEEGNSEEARLCFPPPIPSQ